MSLCLNCMCGAPADKQGFEFYCIYKSGGREHGESRTGYLNRSKVKAQTVCSGYMPREGTRP